MPHPRIPLFLCFLLWTTVSGAQEAAAPGTSEIARWQDDKQGAVSLTFDDGIITQLTVARPILDSLDLRATFYIITGKVAGAAGGKFVGRSPEVIVAETATVPTDSTNFFERASLIAFTGTTEAVDFHSNAGAAYEAGRVADAYALLDEAYASLRGGKLVNTDAVVFHNNPVDTTSWDEYRAYQADGHEIASHTVTHPRLAVLDTANLNYELEQSRADIAHFLGEAATFSAECPYGTEDERVMAYAHAVYPALRNRMPAPYLAELNRGSRKSPGAQPEEYVQWQRGPTDGTTLRQMKDWVDTTLAHDDIWLVEVFHGVDNYGWAARPAAELREYFSYVKDREDRLWIAPFATVTKYIRERMSTTVASELEGQTIRLQLDSSLDPGVYDVPLTLKTYVPGGWKGVRIDATTGIRVRAERDAGGNFVRYAVDPGTTSLTLYRD